VMRTRLLPVKQRLRMIYFKIQSEIPS